jgi:glycerophosphoryl diester phosphodiesterase
MPETEPFEPVSYFDEHVFYELVMLKYTTQRLEVESDAPVWNAMFAAFNVSARNLYYFLGKREANNANKADYQTYYRSFERGSLDEVKEILGELHAQCLHLGKKRFKEPEKKINIEKVRKVSAWVVSNMRELLKSFTADFRSKLRPEWDRLVGQELILRVSSAGLSTSTVTGVMATSVGQMFEFFPPPEEPKK